MTSGIRHEPGLMEIDRPLEPPPPFADRAMRLARAVPASIDRIVDALSGALRSGIGDRKWPWSLSVLAVRPEDRPLAQAIDQQLGLSLDAKIDRRLAELFVEDREEADRVAEVWIGGPDRAFVGLTRKEQTLWLGGDSNGDRSGAKLRDAFRWAGLEPERGETVVELGAAPGSWTAVLSATGAEVVAIDRRAFQSTGLSRKCRAVKADAFGYEPGDTADWLVADLNHAPLEVAKLVGKWGRRAWARQLLVSFKLPMKRKAATVSQIQAILEEAGWRGLRVRQLPRDRNEVTFYGWLEPGIIIRGYRSAPTFRRKQRAT